jgi:hypothetical protein
MVKLFGALKKVRLIAQRFPPNAMEPVRFEINVPIERDAWSGPLAETARALFPPKPAQVIEPQFSVVPKPALVVPAERPKSIVPWVLVGGGATALIVGSVFGLSSRSARNEYEHRMHTDAEADALEDRLKAHGWTANVLFVVSGLAAGAGAILLFSE